MLPFISIGQILYGGDYPQNALWKNQFKIKKERNVDYKYILIALNDMKIMIKYSGLVNNWVVYISNMLTHGISFPPQKKGNANLIGKQIIIFR